MANAEPKKRRSKVERRALRMLNLPFNCFTYLDQAQRKVDFLF